MELLHKSEIRRKMLRLWTEIVREKGIERDEDYDGQVDCYYMTRFDEGRGEPVHGFNFTVFYKTRAESHFVLTESLVTDYLADLLRGVADKIGKQAKETRDLKGARDNLSGKILETLDKALASMDAQTVE